MEKIKLVNEQKKQLRARAKMQRRSLVEETRQAYDKEITSVLMKKLCDEGVNTVLCYVSSELEPDTTELIKMLLDAGKTVAVPRCEDRNGYMEFYCIKSLDELKTGEFGIMEPDIGICPRLNIDEAEDFIGKSACIVPGLLFDTEGYRIGYGKGYYDRYLSRFSGITIGICYDENVMNMLVRDDYDKAVDYIITQGRFIETRRR